MERENLYLENMKQIHINIGLGNLYPGGGGSRLLQTSIRIKHANNVQETRYSASCCPKYRSGTTHSNLNNFGITASKEKPFALTH